MSNSLIVAWGDCKATSTTNRRNRDCRSALRNSGELKAWSKWWLTAAVSGATVVDPFGSRDCFATKLYQRRRPWIRGYIPGVTQPLLPRCLRLPHTLRVDVHVEGQINQPQGRKTP